jgi:exosortase
MENRPSKRTRNLWFLSILVAIFLLCWRTIGVVVKLSLSDDRYSYIVLIPIISGGIMFWKRATIFRNPRVGLGWGVPALLVGLVLFVASGASVGVAVLAIVLMTAGAFLLCFGAQCAREALFPLMFLLLIIPVPASVLAAAVTGLQEGSAQTTAVLFHILGVPVVRHGMRFSLPGVDIEVAEQCSGIRSCTSLFIAGLLASYLLLHAAGTRILFSLLTIPIAIFKNGVRIVTLSWLGVYVDQGFLHGKLHQYGGLPVSVLALGILAPVVLALRRLEGSQGHA